MQHMEHAKEDFTYLDQETGEKFVPYCVEPAVGVDRLLLMFLCDVDLKIKTGRISNKLALEMFIMEICK